MPAHHQQLRARKAREVYPKAVGFRCGPIRPHWCISREVLKADSLLGRRVRVAGRCTASGEGGRAGSWTLAEDGAAVEVRGLVPFSCDDRKGEELTIFAQIEPKSSGSRERLLLRLPD